MKNEVKETPTQRPTTNRTPGETMAGVAQTDADGGISLSSTRTITFPIHFIKSSCFRVIHASGAWYGGDAQKNLHLTFFNERTPIPKKVVVNLNEQGVVVGEDLSQRVSKEGAVREMEVDIVFSIPAAVEFYRTLGENLKAMKVI
jgi:hypothetical protein